MLFDNILEVLKFLSVLILLAIPPWFAMMGKIENKKTRRILWILFFVPYMIAVAFTQNLLPFIAVLVTLFFVKKRDIDESKYFRPIRGIVLKLIGMSITFRIIVNIMTWIYAYLLMKLGFNIKPQDVMKLFFEKPWNQVIYLSIMTVVFAPVLEEFIFRHLLYRFLSKRGKVLSAIITSLLFMLLHYNLAGALSFFMFGLFNCYLYEKYGYWAAVLNHFLFNFTSVSLLLFFKFYNITLF